ncbi:MAG: SEC-C domain-containing protein [Thiohalocapsa sp.]|uniref:YchJ family protein n=1 Tax=Thiohalocapsa sp. TaxID=2497641 RepID=UPI0025F1DBEC|nr:YchJ family metal-binding protein [Thiohalocapsa sp.]MCG6940037.1 SEC-C domain-containing protein [Thiohalocapsa sp.]
MLKPTPSDPCPCGSNRPFGACCGPILAGSPPATAEALMRSRYTAYVLLDAGYLTRTQCPASAPLPNVAAESDADTGLDPDLHWLDLRILRTERGGPGDRDGTVEFIARYKRHGRAGRLHEASRFIRVGDGWCYLDGEQRSETPKATRQRRRR